MVNGVIILLLILIEVIEVLVLIIILINLCFMMKFGLYFLWLWYVCNLFFGIDVSFYY